MDFGDAMKLALGRIKVRRKGWPRADANVQAIEQHGERELVLLPNNIPYEPRRDDMLATDWERVSELGN